MRLMDWCRPTRTRSYPQVPPGLRVYAVGDLHGRFDLLQQATSLIERDLLHQPSDAVTIFLGDYVDRGPQSAEVLDHLARADFPTDRICLRGNHEAMMLEALAWPQAMKAWFQCGGVETAKSYGLSVTSPVSELALEELADQLRAALPPAHLRFLQSTPICASIGDYFFCHAGARPGVPLGEQASEDLMWIRQDYPEDEAGFDKVIVHGHTPVTAPVFTQSHINIDTGAYATGCLTCLRLERGEQAILLTDPPVQEWA